MYAAVWNKESEDLVQVGTSPERLLAALEKNEISKLLNNMPSDNKTYIIYDSNQDKIVSSNDKTLIGLSNKEIAYDLDISSKKI